MTTFPGFGDLVTSRPDHGPLDINELRVYPVNQFSFRDPPDWPVLYRAHDRAGSWDLSVWFSTYRIIRYTATGVWIDRGEEKPKFVSLRSERKWAATTKQEALYGLMRRRAKQIKILTARLQDAEDLLAYIEQIK